MSIGVATAEILEFYELYFVVYRISNTQVVSFTPYMSCNHARASICTTALPGAMVHFF